MDQLNESINLIKKQTTILLTNNEIKELLTKFNNDEVDVLLYIEEKYYNRAAYNNKPKQNENDSSKSKIEEIREIIDEKNALYEQVINRLGNPISDSF